MEVRKFCFYNMGEMERMVPKKDENKKQKERERDDCEYSKARQTGNRLVPA